MTEKSDNRSLRGVRRLYRFAAYNVVAAIVFVVLAATKAWWLALVAIAPAVSAAIWIVAARRVQQRGSP
jgi:hypothetical protein